MAKKKNNEKISIILLLLKYPVYLLILLAAGIWLLFHWTGNYVAVLGIFGLILCLLSIFFAGTFKKWQQLWFWLAMLCFLGLFSMFLYDTLINFFKAPEKTFISLFGLPIPYSGILIVLFFSACFLAMLTGIFITIFKNHGRWKLEEIFPDEKVKNRSKKK